MLPLLQEGTDPVLGVDIVIWPESAVPNYYQRAQGFLDADAVQRLWAAHRSGARDHTNVVWNVLMFQSWLQASGPLAAR